MKNRKPKSEIGMQVPEITAREHGAAKPQPNFRGFWQAAAWRALSPQCDSLKRRLEESLADWGGGLEAALYQEALIHFCGGETQCLRRVPLVLEGCELGTHKVHSHAEGVCFMVTAFSSETQAQESHIRRLLNLTGMRGVQWMNFDHTTLQLTTVETRNGRCPTLP